MKMNFVASATLLLAASFSWQAHAATFDFNFAGPGVSGSVQLTYGTATDAKYPQAFEITGASGTISDSNNGLNIVNASIGSLIPIKNDSPDPTNLLAPHDFTRYPVADSSHGGLSYDNLFYPGGSPQTATDYPPHGGFLDIYGLLFDIGGGRVANIWSNGDLSGTGHGAIDYGFAVVTPSTTLDYIGNGVAVSPEPGTVALLGGGLLVLLFLRRRAARQSSL